MLKFRSFYTLTN